MTILLAVSLVFVIALVAPFINKALKDSTGWILSLLPLGIFAWFATFIPYIAEGNVVRESWPWVAQLGINMSFYLDGLSLLFALIITGVGTFIMIYGGGYLQGHPQIGRFYLSILLFMGAMLGVVLADNIFALFIFWELTSISSYLLIGFKHEYEDSRKSALQALLVTGSGGLALLAGAILLYNITGTAEISEMFAMSDQVIASPLYVGMLILILAGAFTKSAQFPFHFWLPGAMAAPTPVSAYLHSATMVKAGIYLMMRLHPVISGTELWFWIVTMFGMATMGIGAWLALCHTDLKKVLAYSTVMALGTLTMLLGMGHEYAVKAAAVFVLGHSLYKGALFMIAGSIDHETGTRDATQLGGLRKLMPYTFAFAVISALSMAGMAPFLGFIGKELVYEAALSANAVPIVIISVAVIANIAVVATGGIVAIRPFFGELKETPKKPHEAPLSMWIGPAFLSLGSILFGLLPFLIDKSLIQAAASSIAGVPLEIYLSLWHGINIALILSVVTFLSGVFVYYVWDHIRSNAGATLYDALFGSGPVKAYEGILAGILGFADKQTRFFQNGYLRYYIVTLLFVLVSLTSYTFFTKTSLVLPTDFSDVYLTEWIIGIAIVVAAFGAVKAKSGLAAIASLGVMGYGIAMVYIIYSAPDLAITQVLVETLTVILAALVLIHLPNSTTKTKTSSKVRDAIIAGGAGVTVMLVLYALLAIEFDPYMSDYFAENSYVIAKGRNIVNVILVDYRALDTLGEIIVIGVAAVGAFGLVKFGKKLFTAEDRQHD